MSAKLFQEIYDRLYNHYGPQNWWPGDSDFEILVGAVLTQNTNWDNVAKALEKLRDAGVLSYQAMSATPADELAELIRPSGYYNIKSKRLHNLLRMISKKYGGELDCLINDTTEEARASLLSVKGVGPETADAILLYCGKHPVFVVDTYTHRVFSRHGLVAEECDYHELQEEFTRRLEPDPHLYGEYHALIVMVAKEFCKKGVSLCERCPLAGVE